MKHPLLIASILASFLALGCSAQSTPEPPAPESEASATKPPPKTPKEETESEEKAEPTAEEPQAEAATPEPQAAESKPVRRPRFQITKPLSAEEACIGGVIMDDGVADTGYGFVPQATDGVYVQRYERDQFASAEIDTVCACLMKTKFVNNIRFEVVFFEEVNGLPAAEPYATFPAVARELPTTVADSRVFYQVDISGVSLPEGASYIGLRWDPNRFKFTFVCTDTDEPDERGEPVPVFFHDDVKTRWQSVFQSRDPIFAHHYSILLRATAAKPATASAESGKN